MASICKTKNSLKSKKKLNVFGVKSSSMKTFGFFLLLKEFLAL